MLGSQQFEMPVRTYLLAYNYYDKGVNQPALERYLIDSADILGYWNHLPLVYFFKTRLTALEATFRLNPFFPNGIFMVVEMNSQNMNGRLPPAAWEWFYADHSVKRPPGWGTNSLGSITYQP